MKSTVFACTGVASTFVSSTVWVIVQQKIAPAPIDGIVKSLSLVLMAKWFDNQYKILCCGCIKCCEKPQYVTQLEFSL